MAYAAYWIWTHSSHASALGGGPAGGLSYTSQFQSQPKQTTPSVPASSGKPAQYEKGTATSSSTAGVATKPATTTSTGTRSTTTGSTATASSVINIGASTGAKASGGVTLTPGSSKVTNTAVSTPKPELPKVTSTVTKPTATTVVAGTTGKKEDVKSKETKVKSEVSAKASTPAPAVDPFDALAGSLPSSQPITRPQFTGPEVKEPNTAKEVAPRTGDRDDTLPPGYRLKDMEKKMPAGQPEKPKEVSKPPTLDEAVDCLSAGFVSAPPPRGSKPEVKHETVAAADSRKNYSPAPPTQKKQDTSVPPTLSPAPPADKKPKIEKTAKDTATAAAQDVKPKTEQKKLPADKPKQGPKAGPILQDPFDALIDTLPEAKPVPEAPKLKPGEIVDEKKHKSEKGARVGEREDTLPPEYRFTEDKNKKLPPPPKEPSMDPNEALDILSGDFVDATVASAVQSPVPPKGQAKQPKVENLSALDALAGDFVAPDKAKKVCSGVSPAPPAAPKSTPPKSKQEDPMALDALDILGDTLPKAKPVPKSPKLKPEEIVDEAKLKSEKGARVGERDDTIPPDYRFPGTDPKKQPPPPKKEPSMDPTEALDILSGDFTSSSAAPVVQSSVPPSAPPASKAKDFGLEDLDGDFVAPTSASKVCSAPTATGKQADSMTLDALDALGDTLPVAKPVPESPKLRPEDIVDEAKHKSEKGVFVGEREDTIPPDYRFPKGDSKTQPPPPKKEPSMDPNEALDILSGDFSSPAVAPAVRASVVPSAPPASSSADFDLEELGGDFVAPKSASKVCSAASAPTSTDREMSDGAASAMDKLSETLEDIRPAPEPAPVPPKNIVKEKEVVEERVSKPGERDDTLPPEYRPTEADIKAAAEAKAKAANKQPSIDEASALDALSKDFGSEVPQAATQCQASPLNTASSQKESGPVMDKLAATLVPPGFPSTKPSDSKPKGKGRKSKSAPKKAPVTDAPPAMKTLPAKPSTDVASSTTTKKGGKS